MKVDLTIGEWKFTCTGEKENRYKVVAEQWIDGKKTVAYVAVCFAPSGKLLRYDNTYVAWEITEERKIDYDDDWAMQSIAMKLEEWFSDCPYELRGFNLIHASPLAFFQMEDGRIAVQIHITVYFYRADWEGDPATEGLYCKSSMGVLMIID